MVCLIPSAATVFGIVSLFSPNEEYETEDDSTTPKTPPRRERLYRTKAKLTISKRTQIKKVQSQNNKNLVFFFK